MDLIAALAEEFELDTRDATAFAGSAIAYARGELLDIEIPALVDALHAAVPELIPWLRIAHEVAGDKAPPWRDPAPYPPPGTRYPPHVVSPIGGLRLHDAAIFAAVAQELGLSPARAEDAGPITLAFLKTRLPRSAFIETRRRSNFLAGDPGTSMAAGLFGVYFCA